MGILGWQDCCLSTGGQRLPTAGGTRDRRTDPRLPNEQKGRCPRGMSEVPLQEARKDLHEALVNGGVLCPQKNLSSNADLLVENLPASCCSRVCGATSQLSPAGHITRAIAPVSFFHFDSSET